MCGRMDTTGNELSMVNDSGAMIEDDVRWMSMHGTW
jgi:hypothetical protein